MSQSKYPRTPMAAAIAAACTFTAAQAYGGVTGEIWGFEAEPSTGVHVDCEQGDEGNLDCVKTFDDIVANNGVLVYGYGSYNVNETITNNSGTPWTDYHVDFTVTPGQDYQADCDVFGTFGFEGTCTRTMRYEGYMLNVGSTDLGLFSHYELMDDMAWFYFDSPLSSGQSFDLSFMFGFTALLSEDGGQQPPIIIGPGSGAVRLNQYPTIPEPGSIALMGAGLGAVGLAGLRRRKTRHRVEQQ